MVGRWPGNRSKGTQMSHPWINGDRLIKPGTLSSFVNTTDYSSALGDCVEVWSTSTSKYFVRAISSAAGGITIS